MYNFNIKRCIFNRITPRTITNEELIIKWADKLNKPHWNRLVMGAGAFAFQPIIDYFNPLVDDDTAATSAIRTGSKALAGTPVGFLVRYLSYLCITKKPFRTKFMPRTIYDYLKKKRIDHTVYYNGISTLLGLGVMLFTNFLLDAPITNALTKFGLKKRESIKAKRAKTNPQNDTSSDKQEKTPKEKFTDAFNKLKISGRRVNNEP